MITIRVYVEICTVLTEGRTSKRLGFICVQKASSARFNSTASGVSISDKQWGDEYIRGVDMVDLLAANKHHMPVLRQYNTGKETQPRMVWIGL